MLSAIILDVGACIVSKNHYIKGATQSRVIKLFLRDENAIDLKTHPCLITNILGKHDCKLPQ